jgi:hypothetical protein
MEAKNCFVCFQWVINYFGFSFILLLTVCHTAASFETSKRQTPNQTATATWFNMQPSMRKTNGRNTMIEAHYTQGKQPTVSFAQTVNGRRAWGETLPVTGKREARKVAAANNATPWNF